MHIVSATCRHWNPRARPQHATRCNGSSTPKAGLRKPQPRRIISGVRTEVPVKLVHAAVPSSAWSRAGLLTRCTLQGQIGRLQVRNRIRRTGASLAASPRHSSALPASICGGTNRLGTGVARENRCATYHCTQGGRRCTCMRQPPRGWREGQWCMMPRCCARARRQKIPSTDFSSSGRAPRAAVLRWRLGKTPTRGMPIGSRECRGCRLRATSCREGRAEAAEAFGEDGTWPNKARHTRLAAVPGSVA